MILILEDGFSGTRDFIKAEGVRMMLDKLDDGGDVLGQLADGRGFC